MEPKIASTMDSARATGMFCCRVSSLIRSDFVIAANSPLTARKVPPIEVPAQSVFERRSRTKSPAISRSPRPAASGRQVTFTASWQSAGPGSARPMLSEDAPEGIRDLAQGDGGLDRRHDGRHQALGSAGGGLDAKKRGRDRRIVPVRAQVAEPLSLGLLDRG